MAEIYKVKARCTTYYYAYVKAESLEQAYEYARWDMDGGEFEEDGYDWETLDGSEFEIVDKDEIGEEMVYCACDDDEDDDEDDLLDGDLEDQFERLLEEGARCDSGLKKGVQLC